MGCRRWVGVYTLSCILVGWSRFKGILACSHWCSCHPLPACRKKLPSVAIGSLAANRSSTSSMNSVLATASSCPREPTFTTSLSTSSRGGLRGPHLTACTGHPIDGREGFLTYSDVHDLIVYTHFTSFPSFYPAISSLCKNSK